MSEDAAAGTALPLAKGVAAGAGGATDGGEAGTALPLAEGVAAGAGGAAGGGEGTGLGQTTPRSHARWCGASCHSRSRGVEQLSAVAGAEPRA